MSNDCFSIAVLQKIKAKFIIDAAYERIVSGKSNANFVFIMPESWWRSESAICGYFGFNDVEIDYAVQSPTNYLGTKNGFDCYVRIKT